MNKEKIMKKLLMVCVLLLVSACGGDNPTEVETPPEVNLPLGGIWKYTTPDNAWSWEFWMTEAEQVNSDGFIAGGSGSWTMHRSSWSDLCIIEYGDSEYIKEWCHTEYGSTCETYVYSVRHGSSFRATLNPCLLREYVLQGTVDGQGRVTGDLYDGGDRIGTIQFTVVD